MWTPDLQLRLSAGLGVVIVLTHAAVLMVVVQLGGHWLWLAPLALGSAVYFVLQDSIRCLPWSVTRLWLADGGWHWERKDGRTAGPFQLHSASRVDTRFIRVSLQQPWRWPRHFLITEGNVGQNAFRQLQVFLRWAPDKNQPLGT